MLTREHLGDLVCTTPALRSLRRLYPEAHITVDVGQRAASVLANSPYVDELIIRPDHQGITGKLKGLLALRGRHFDLGIILDDSADMPLTLWLAGIPRRVGLTRKPRFARLLTDPVGYAFDRHEMIDNFRNVVAALGADISDSRPELFPSPEDCEQANHIWQSSGIHPESIAVGLNPGASAPSNRWPAERFAELGDRLAELPNIEPVLLGGPGDLSIAEEIVSLMARPPIVLTGKLSVLELAAALPRCAIVVSGDTGPMHICCAVGVPVVALFGPADPAESGPSYMPGNLVIRKTTGCPHCTKYRCTQGGSCMREITVNDVLKAVRTLLESRGTS